MKLKQLKKKLKMHKTKLIGLWDLKSKDMKILVLNTVLILLIGCQIDNKSKLYNKVDKIYASKSTTNFKIDFNSLLEYSWDTLYVFDYTATPEFINYNIGCKYNYYSEFTDKIIFTKGNSVVYHEDIPVSFEGIDKKGGGLLLYFPFNPSEKIYKVSSKHAQFDVEQGENNFGEIVYYFNGNAPKSAASESLQL
ncbi:MAG: hypothetical protein RIQ33_135 [Bacteroidota bacterium]|jgi:hypothetical protein